MSFANVIERLEKLESPYPGLRPFDVAESHLFFGRDPQVAELVRRLERNRFVAVLGVSGSGKSSLVRAGLIPALERGGVWEAGRRWRRVITQPGGAPFDNLATDLQRAGLDTSQLRASSHGLIEAARELPADDTLLLVVDQFEELFRYKDVEAITPEARRVRDRQAADADEFVQLLLESTRHHPPIYIVLTMRSDYVGDCAAFRDLPEALNDCQYLVPRMTRPERKDAIEGPLGRVRMSSALVQRLLNDVGDEPDQLPVLQHALMRTWNQWRQSDPGATRSIDVRDYEAVGGFEGALNRHADELLVGVPEYIAACIFKRLTARGRSSRERRDPTTLATLWKVCGADTVEHQAQVTAVIDRFRSGQATFLRPLTGDIGPDTYIDITHESLIRLWRKLRDTWVPEEQLSAKTLLEVAERAANRKARSGELLTGRDLARVEDWDRSRNKSDEWATHYVDADTLTDVLDFVRDSRQKERRRVLWRRVRWSAVGLVFLWLLGASYYQFLSYARAQAALARERANIAVENQMLAEARQASAESDLRVVQTDLVQADVRAATVDGRKPGASELKLKPRLYIQVRSDADARRSARLNPPLEKAGYIVPKPEVLNTGPSTSEVRFFRKEDERERALAEKVVPILANEGLFDVRVVFVPGFEQSKKIRENHLELWLAPENLAGLARRLDDRSIDVRRAAGGRLASLYQNSPQAIDAVLDLLSPRQLGALSADGRINALFFLNASEAGGWTAEQRQRALDAVQRIRTGGTAIGDSTDQQLVKLEQKLGRR